MDGGGTRIVLFGNFGSMNIGNEATLLAISSHLRRLKPDCALSCICSNPSKVIAGFGIDAVPHTVRSRRIWDRRLPLGKRLPATMAGLAEELHEYFRAWRTLRGAHLFVVPGTGLVNDAFGLSGWGPYGLLKWSLTARLRGCRVVILSVGAGPIDSAVGRRLVKAALSLAHYRSYRDLPSKLAAKAAGVRAERDPVFPDLAFGLTANVPEAFAGAPRSRRTVALGLMEYVESYSEAAPTGDTYGRYLEALAHLVGWLLHEEFDVKLVLGDDDTAVLGDFTDALRTHLGSYDESRVVYRPAASVEELLAELGQADAVVATRFHNVLLSLLVEKPVLAISFHHKCSSLMEEMGLSAYCQPMGEIDADMLIARFTTLMQHAPEVTRALAHRVAETRAELNRQYELVFVAGEREATPRPSVVSHVT